VIRVRRPARAPAILALDGAAWAAALHREYLVDRAAFRDGSRSFAFEGPRGYAHDHLRSVRLLCEILTTPLSAPLRRRTMSLLQRATKPTSEYSAMVRQYLQSKGFAIGA
jgi:hypothetical protein